MSHLLHIDSSVKGEDSVSRKLTARAAAVWRAAHPGGTVAYRDLGAEPLPHFDVETFKARSTPPEQHTSVQTESLALSERLIDEIKGADAVLLGLPLYNFGPPSSVKAWVDHLILPGRSHDPETGAGLLGEREFVVVATRGGGYGEGTPREGWEHAQDWLPHGISMTGLKPRFITAELTLATVVPAMAELVPLAEKSLAAAESEVDALWPPARTA